MIPEPAQSHISQSRDAPMPTARDALAERVECATVDPLAFERRRARRAGAAGGILLTAVAFWSLGSGAPRPWPPPLVPAAEIASKSPEGPFVDLAAYSAAVWTPIANAVEPVPDPTPPRPPLTLQLVAVHRQTGVEGRDIHRATLYDPSTDRLVVVADGDVLGAFKVTSVTADGVALADAIGPRTLTLDSGPPSNDALPERRAK